MLTEHTLHCDLPRPRPVTYVAVDGYRRHALWSFYRRLHPTCWHPLGQLPYDAFCDWLEGQGYEVRHIDPRG